MIIVFFWYFANYTIISFFFFFFIEIRISVCSNWTLKNASCILFYWTIFGERRYVGMYCYLTINEWKFSFSFKYLRRLNRWKLLNRMFFFWTSLLDFRSMALVCRLTISTLLAWFPNTRIFRKIRKNDVYVFLNLCFRSCGIVSKYPLHQLLYFSEISPCIINFIAVFETLPRCLCYFLCDDCLRISILKSHKFSSSYRCLCTWHITRGHVHLVLPFSGEKYKKKKLNK